MIGGATHTFEDKGFEFDVGIHYIGGKLHDFLSPERRLFAAVSDGQLEFTACDPTFDVCYNSETGEAIPMTGSPSANDRTIAGAFAANSGAAEALRAYRRLELLGWLLGCLMCTFKALPPLALRLAWPVFGPLWRRWGACSVAEMTAAAGMTGKLSGLGGVVTYLYGAALQ